MWHIFRPQKTDCQNTTFTTQTTTFSPQIHHTKTSKNPHIPKQNHPSPPQIKKPQTPPAILPADGLLDHAEARPLPHSLRSRSHHCPRPPHRPQLRQLHRPLHPPRRSGADQGRVPSLRRAHRHAHLLVHDRLHAHLAHHRLAGRPLPSQTHDRHRRSLLERHQL